jgi:hypothetical protein
MVDNEAIFAKKKHSHGSFSPFCIGATAARKLRSVGLVEFCNYVLELSSDSEVL